MYQPHYINPLIQFGKIEFDLILEDDENVLPPMRVTKSFPEDVEQSTLEAEAQREVDRIITEHNAALKKADQLPFENVPPPDVDLPDILPDEINLTE